MLDAKLKLRRAERDVLAVRGWRVTFERWANCFVPLVENLDSLEWEEIDRRRLVVDQVYEAGRAALESWKRQPEAADDLGRSFLERVERVLSSVRDLRTTLVIRKGRLADPGASEIKSAPPESAGADLTTILRSIATSQREASASIEDELTRLRAERDVEHMLSSQGSAHTK